MCNAYSNTDAYPHGNTDTDTYCYANTTAAYADCDSSTNADAYSNADTYSHSGATYTL